MWSSSRPDSFDSRNIRVAGLVLAVSGLTFLQACTVQPLNATQSNIGNTNAGLSQTTADVLSRMEVAKVNSRIGQQVRNALLFRLNGGQMKEGGHLKVNLAIHSSAQTLAVETNELAPTSARLELTGNYTIVDKRDGSTVGTGQRKAIAAYDLTPQSFANERAYRDAQDRSAKALAEQLRLAIAQDIIGS